jgi:hypothetical protein
MKIELQNTGSTDRAHHISVVIDDGQAGILYLNDTELDKLIKIIRYGCRENEVEFINNAYIDNDSDEEVF